MPRMKASVRDRGLSGAYWTRTSDPIDVNDVLYQLSQSTICAADFRLTTKYILAEVPSFVKHYFAEIFARGIAFPLFRACRRPALVVYWEK